MNKREVASIIIASILVLGTIALLIGLNYAFGEVFVEKLIKISMLLICGGVFLVALIGAIAIPIYDWLGRFFK